jgi:hypothetical protein
MPPSTYWGSAFHPPIPPLSRQTTLGQSGIVIEMTCNAPRACISRDGDRRPPNGLSSIVGGCGLGDKARFGRMRRTLVTGSSRHQGVAVAPILQDPDIAVGGPDFEILRYSDGTWRSA